ncbi:MAG TPA: hypothetical protein VL728_12905 [Cyclobacteriaceae bacterium]|jgi:hypothetical protein|nr:hypothetical protein [Cyclobacteriaceae bacterium]
MVHTTDKPGLKYQLKDSPYSPDYARAIRYLNRTRDRDYVPMKAKVYTILLLASILVSILVTILLNR